MAKDLNKQPLDFEPMIAQGADTFRKHNEALDKMEKLAATAAEEDPAQLEEMARTALCSVRDERRSLRRHLCDRFGIEVGNVSYLPDEERVSVPPLRIVDKERLQALLEDGKENREGPIYAHVLDLLHRWVILETARLYIEHATKQSCLTWLAGEVTTSYLTEKYVMWGMKCRVVQADSRDSAAAKAILSTYFYVMRNASIGYASCLSLGEGPPFLNKAAPGGGDRHTICLGALTDEGVWGP